MLAEPGNPLYSYWWYTGNWGECSVECGGGTQTRQVICVREHAGESNHGSNWTNIDDACCIKNGLTKPITSKSCNTQECRDCKFSATNTDCANNTSQNITFGWFETGISIPTNYIIYWNGNILSHKELL
jgi:hypothetical protein